MKKAFGFFSMAIVAVFFAFNIASADKLYPNKDKNGSGTVTYEGKNIVKRAPNFDYVTADSFTPTSEYEEAVQKVQEFLNQLSPEAAKLRTLSENTFMLGNANTFSRLTDVTTSVLANLLAVVENYTPKTNKDVISTLDTMKAKLSKAYGYSFGPDRPASFDIPLISNETKGEMEVTIGFKNGTDEEGNAINVPIKHLVRYAVAPGLHATKQDEREIIVVDRLPDGEYKIAVGIFYTGQETCKVVWDERTYISIDSFLEYHNVCKAQKAWIKCKISKCVSYSQNATVNTPHVLSKKNG